MKLNQLNKLSVDVIYEDADILAINKPAGLLVHSVNLPTGSTVPEKLKNENTLVDWLDAKYPQLKGVGDDLSRPGIVHRLDRDTSGILLIAKNQKAFENLKEQFKNRTIQKQYIALVHKNIKQDGGVIDLPIGRHKKDFRKKSASKTLAGKIREATTKYKVLERFWSTYTLVEARPKTGRTHQIRVHFKAISHPLVCDKLYGPKKLDCPFNLTRHFLHAQSIEFTLLDGTRLCLRADLPDDLENTLRGLRKQK